MPMGGAAAAAAAAAALTLVLLAEILMNNNSSVRGRSSLLQRTTTSSSLSSSRSYEAEEMGNLNCYASLQGRPIFANLVEGVQRPFYLSLQDKGSVPVQDMLRGKPFAPVSVSRIIQRVLAGIGRDGSRRIVVDVGANVGWAAFAAASMGFEVLAFEPVPENIQKLCDGVHLNRAKHLVKVFHSAVSNQLGKTILHKVAGRYDNTAVSEVGATLNVRGEVTAFEVPTVTLDSSIPAEMMERVLMLKIDVQGWEYHVLSGARKLLQLHSPYIMYEEDEKLLSASNSSSAQVRQLLRDLGYKDEDCVKIGDDRHCTKHREAEFNWMP